VQQNARRNAYLDGLLGQSSMPWRVGSGLMASVMFPAAGISAASDQARAMVAAGIWRGASVGFVPGLFRFSKDPQRPLGIDFLEGHILTEWSICSVPCNPVCLAVGPASSKSDTADRRREARALADMARAISKSIPDPPMTREQRIAEASAFRRAAMGS
jgi:hypothetical protein